MIAEDIAPVVETPAPPPTAPDLSSEVREIRERVENLHRSQLQFRISIAMKTDHLSALSSLSQDIQAISTAPANLYLHPKQWLIAEKAATELLWHPIAKTH